MPENIPTKAKLPTAT